MGWGVGGGGCSLKPEATTTTKHEKMRDDVYVVFDECLSFLSQHPTATCSPYSERQTDRQTQRHTDTDRDHVHTHHACSYASTHAQTQT